MKDFMQYFLILKILYFKVIKHTMQKSGSKPDRSGYHSIISRIKGAWYHIKTNIWKLLSCLIM